MLILTRKVLKKGHLNAEFIECGTSCWNNAVAYPSVLIDEKIRTVFRIMIPSILDTLLRAKNLGNVPSSGDDVVGDISAFVLNLTQLIVYLLATGCLSFSQIHLDDQGSSFKKECEVFWSLVLGGISRIPGGNAETICCLLDDVSGQNISDPECDAGRIFPALLLITAMLINCSRSSNLNDTNSRNQERIISLLFSLYKCVVRAGLRRFQELPTMFAFESLATFAVSLLYNLYSFLSDR